MYQRPDMITPSVDAQGNPIDPRKIQQHFEVGNVYVQFREEERAANVLKNLSGSFYAGHPIIVDFSPLTDFREATCRQYDESTCNCGGYCNFMHLKRIGRELRHQLFGSYRRRQSYSRSRSPHKHRSSHEERSYGGRGHSRRHDDRDNYHESRSRRHRSTSPGGKRNCSLVHEGSEERPAKIEQWNRQREQRENAKNFDKNAANNNNENGDNGYVQNDD